MSYGIYVNKNGGWYRPKSKKEIKDILAEKGPQAVELEATSMFGDEKSGALVNKDHGQTFTFVGPDPYTRRSFYGNIKINPKTGKWGVT